MKNYEVKHIEAKIIVTAAFLKKASTLGSAEYNAVLQLRRDWPDYKFEVKKTDTSNRKASKSKNLTYKHMEDYIKAVCAGEAEALAALAALKKVQQLSKIHSNPYLYVRDWFIKTYPECRAEAAAQEAIAADQEVA